MPAPELQIVGNHKARLILQGGRVVAGPYSSDCNAVAALRGVERRLSPVRIIPCLSCRHHFKSTGPGNRLCPSCGREA